VIKSPLSEFCDERGISGQIKSAFGAYIRSEYAQKFLLGSDSETVYLIIGKLTQEQLGELWQGFVLELSKYLTK
jgi:hypothetical protein